MTEFVGSEAKQLYDEHKHVQANLEAANKEIERVRTESYDIPAHADSDPLVALNPNTYCS